MARLSQIVHVTAVIKDINLSNYSQPGLNISSLHNVNALETMLQNRQSIKTWEAANQEAQLFNHTYQLHFTAAAGMSSHTWTGSY